MSQSRQLAAIMFTDIVGYTALMGEDEQKAFELLKKNRLVQRPFINKFNGRWLKEIGDGVLASFSTVSEAVYCAKAIQEACLKEDNLKLRIGIHQGEVVFEGDDVFGDGVNIASRLEPLAPPGGILISEAVHNNISNKRNIASTFVRKEQLKNVKEPVSIYQVHMEGVIPLMVDSESPVSLNPSKTSTYSRKFAFVALGMIAILFLFYSIYTERTSEKVEVADKSIAVLPFKNMSNDPDQDYFSDGISEEITNVLAQIPNLKVISRTSAFQFRGEEKDIKSIGKELGVATILEGSVRKSNNRIRITAQLINASDGFHLWSGTYERGLDDIFAIQDELSRSIVHALKMQILETGGPSVSEQTISMEAYNLYLQGRYFWNKRSREGLEQSIEYFEQAIAVDSLYAVAYSALADSYLMSIERLFLEPIVTKQKIMSAALKALEINNSLGQAYATLGWMNFLLEWNWDEAESNFQRALTLNPNYASAHQWYAIFLYHMGDHDTAIIEINKALDLDPLSLIINWVQTEIMALEGDFQNALFQTHKLLQMDNDFVPAHRILYRIYYAQGKWDLAFQHFKPWRAAYSEDVELLQAGYKKSGWKGAAELMIQILETNSQNTFISPLIIAEYYMLADNHEQALIYLEKGFVQRSPYMVFLEDLQWRPLHLNPRFQALLEKMGLPPVSG